MTRRARGWLAGFLAVGLAACGGGAQPPSTHAISGTVSGAPGATVTLGGAATRTTTVDANGGYTFAALADGAYVVTPEKAAHGFTPTSRPVVLSGADRAGIDFQGTANPTFGLSGAIRLGGAPLAGVGVAVTRGGVAVGSPAVTDATGAFAFTGLAPGDYVLTPALPGYDFSPPSLEVTVAGASQVGLDFAAAGNLRIEGTIGGLVAGGDTVTLTGPIDGSVVTDGQGGYAFTGLVPGAYLLVPSGAGRLFTPAQLAVTLTAASATAQDFTAAAVPTYTVAGAVAGNHWRVQIGIPVTLSGPRSRTTLTDANGAFSFTDLPEGDYAISASYAGWDIFDAATGQPAWSAHVAADVTGVTLAEVPVVKSRSVVGTVRYAGTATGTVHVQVRTAAGEAVAGIAGAMAPCPAPATGQCLDYWIRGVTTGADYRVTAFMDVVGTHGRNANLPAGEVSPVAVDAAAGNTTGVDLTLVDPPPPARVAPTGLTASPGAGTLLLTWGSPEVGGAETAVAYRVSTGSTAAASDGPTFVVKALGVNAAHAVVGGLTDGAAIHARVAGLFPAAGGALLEGPAATVGPVTIGAPAGGSTVSGTITFPSAATGPLYVVLADMATGTYNVQAVLAPVSPQPFSLPGVADGDKLLMVILDQDGSHHGAVPDLRLQRPLTVAGGVSGVGVAMAGDDAGFTVTTLAERWDGGAPAYQAEVVVSPMAQDVLFAAVVEGEGLPLQVSLPYLGDLRTRTAPAASPPAVGAPYRVHVYFGAGFDPAVYTVYDAAVTGVVPFPSTVGTVTAPPRSATMPRLAWTLEAPLPTGSSQEVELADDAGALLFSAYGLGPSVRSVDYQGAPLQPGRTYRWSHLAIDGQGNRARSTITYAVP
jgi:hypothetical protein